MGMLEHINRVLLLLLLLVGLLLLPQLALAPESTTHRAAVLSTEADPPAADFIPASSPPPPEQHARLDPQPAATQPPWHSSQAVGSRAGNMSACAVEPPAWPTSRLLARRPDWIFAADGTAESSWATQFQLVPAPAKYGDRIVHLVNRLSGGCVNLVQGTSSVRGHRNSDPRNVAAPPSTTTALRWTQVVPDGAAPAQCARPARLRFQFTDRDRGSTTHLHVQSDGSLSVAGADACAGGACAFDVIPVEGADGEPPRGEPAVSALTYEGRRLVWFRLRSVLTGRWVRLHHTEMPEAPSWLGIHPPRATRKSPPRRLRPRSARDLAANGRCKCPLTRAQAPSGWEYNCSLWAPLIDRYLAPWAEGNVTATVLDMAFWKALYGEERAHAVPGVHVSSVRGRLYARENIDYRMPLFRDMLRTVRKLVALPDVEFVTHLWDHPKVGRESPLPVFAHYADVAHRDIPIPAPWSWDEKLHTFPQPWVKLSGCSLPWGSRSQTLYFRGGCNGPTRGWRGPLWKFYPRKRANRLSAASGGTIDAGVFDHCDSPKLSPAEWAWDAQMEKEMTRHAPKQRIEPFANNCRHRHLLHIDGNVASSRLASELHVGSTIFKQHSFSNEYFYPLLRPWEHYVPVAANLRDVPEKLAWAKANPQRAEAIAAAGTRFAREHLHVASISCYWWQLLTAFAELQDFQPRSSPQLGFRPLPL